MVLPYLKPSDTARRSAWNWLNRSEFFLRSSSYSFFDTFLRRTLTETRGLNPAFIIGGPSGVSFGTQLSTFCSVGTFRALYMPYYKKMNDWIHAHTAWKTFKHSCGAVETLIPSIIESGFDILNPVQVSAAGMDAEKLKAKYGRDVVFWGGGIDTQKTLMFGRPDQVRAEVFERCRIFGKGGGFIFNAIHNIQANVPVPNVIALFDALREVNG